MRRTSQTSRLLPNGAHHRTWHLRERIWRWRRAVSGWPRSSDSFAAQRLNRDGTSRECWSRRESEHKARSACYGASDRYYDGTGELQASCPRTAQPMCGPSKSPASRSKRGRTLPQPRTFASRGLQRARRPELHRAATNGSWSLVMAPRSQQPASTSTLYLLMRRCAAPRCS